MNLTLLNVEPQSSVFAQISLRYSTIKILDGTTPTANEIEIKVGEGNLTWTEAKTMEYLLDRQLLDEVREGDDIPMDVSFDFIWDYITGTTGSGGVPSIEDALKQINAASTWISTDSDICRPYAVDIQIEYVPTNCAAEDQETITLPDFRYENLAHDLRAGTIACTGRCNATQATAIRAAQP